MSLPARHRLRRAADITATVRGGRRHRGGPVVVHVRRRSPAVEPAVVRLASVTPRAVGGAVVRNRVRRRGHAALLQVLQGRHVAASADVVVRYLPGSGACGVDDLAGALTRALERAGVLGTGGAGGRDGTDGSGGSDGSGGPGG